MQSAAGFDRFDPGTQPKVIGVAENDLARRGPVDSSSSKRIPFTVPAVPTGMKTGVSITPRRVVKHSGSRLAILSSDIET